MLIDCFYHHQRAYKHDLWYIQSVVQFLPQDQWDVDMDASESLTSVDEDDDAPNLWKTLHCDLFLQDMLPLVTDSNDFDGDNSSFVITSQGFSEDEMSFH